jgi:excisionase family DNA binding protein
MVSNVQVKVTEGDFREEAGPICVSISEACRLLSVSRSSLYNMIASGEIEKVKLRSSSRILTSSLHMLIEANRG